MPRSVPQIKGLRVEDFVCFIETEVDYGVDYLPKTTKKLHWIGNRLSIYVLYQLYHYRQYFWPRKFKEMISKAIKDRDEIYLKQKFYGNNTRTKNCQCIEFFIYAIK